MKHVLCVAVCLVYVLGTAPVVRGQDEMFAEELRVSGRSAILLSVMFPGLGQMASGHKLKGGVLFLAELVALIVAVDAHEEYDTRLSVYEESLGEYAAMRIRGNYQAAEAKWKRLMDLNDDLHSLHDRRQIFGYAAAGIYALNVIDILFLRSGGPTTEHKTDGTMGISAGLVGGTPGIRVWKKF